MENQRKNQNQQEASSNNLNSQSGTGDLSLFNNLAKECVRLNDLKPKNKLSDPEIRELVESLMNNWAITLPTLKIIIDGYIAERFDSDYLVFFRYNPFITDYENIVRDYNDLYTNIRILVEEIKTGKTARCLWPMIESKFLNNPEFKIGF